jgi:hypothetical protein
MGRKIDAYWAEQFSSARPSEHLVRAHAERDPVLAERANRFARRSLAWGLLAIPTVILFGLGGVFGIVAIAYGARALNADTDRVVSACTGVGCGAIAVVVAALFIAALVTYDSNLVSP